MGDFRSDCGTFQALTKKAPGSRRGHFCVYAGCQSVVKPSLRAALAQESSWQTISISGCCPGTQPGWDETSADAFGDTPDHLTLS